MGLLERLEKDKESKTSEDAISRYLQLDVDIIQTDDSIVVVAHMPGVEPADLDIDFESEDDVVTIYGKRSAPFFGDDDEEYEYLRRECDWGHFYRQIILPEKIDASAAQAKFRKGVLFLTLPFGEG
ncbi:MAG: Hsp20/alpha crystallin family protein [bacterium]